MLRRSRGRDGRDGRRANVATSGIVIAGDDPDAVLLLARILEATGQPVEAITDRSSVVAAVIAKPCRAVVVAFSGGHSTNLSVVDAVRSHGEPVVRSTPIVLVADDDKNLTYSWQSGIDEHLVRPIHADDLVAAVEAAMNRSENERTDHRRAELRKAQAAALADPDEG